MYPAVVTPVSLFPDPDPMFVEVQPLFSSPAGGWGYSGPAMLIYFGWGLAVLSISLFVFA